MAYGFEVKNAAGRIVTDADFVTLGVPSKVTVPQHSSGGGRVDGASMPSGMPFFECPTNTELRFLSSNTGVTPYAIFKLVSGSWVANTTWPVQCAGVSPYNEIAAPTGYGIVVKNAAGDITFSSAAALLGLRDAIYSTYPIGTTSKTHTISADTTHIFYACSLIGFNFISQTQGSMVVAPTLRRTSSTSVTITRQNVYSPGPPVTFGPYESSYQIVTAKIVW